MWGAHLHQQALSWPSTGDRAVTQDVVSVGAGGMSVWALVCAASPKWEQWVSRDPMGGQEAWCVSRGAGQAEGLRWGWGKWMCMCWWPGDISCGPVPGLAGSASPRAGEDGAVPLGDRVLCVLLAAGTSLTPPKLRWV